MNCRELVECITDYVEGHLPSGETRRFEDHLTQCPHCQAYLDQMRAVIQAVGKLEEKDISPAARQELLNAFRNWRKQSSTE